MTYDDNDDAQYDRAVEAARAQVTRRAADTGVRLNVDPSIPDVVIAAMDSTLTLAGVRAYLLQNEGEKFKLLREGDELCIAAAERID